MIENTIRNDVFCKYDYMFNLMLEFTREREIEALYQARYTLIGMLTVMEACYLITCEEEYFLRKCLNCVLDVCKE